MWQNRLEIFAGCYHSARQVLTLETLIKRENERARERENETARDKESERERERESERG